MDPLSSKLSAHFLDKSQVFYDNSSHFLENSHNFLISSRPDVYFLEKTHKNGDVVVNISQNSEQKRLSVDVDVDYDNETQIIVDSNKISFGNQGNSSNTSSENSHFLKQKLQNKGNEVVKNAVFDCSDEEHLPKPAKTVCSLCNVSDFFEFSLKFPCFR